MDPSGSFFPGEVDPDEDDEDEDVIGCHCARARRSYIRALVFYANCESHKKVTASAP